MAELQLVQLLPLLDLLLLSNKPAQRQLPHTLQLLNMLLRRLPLQLLQPKVRLVQVSSAKWPVRQRTYLRSRVSILSCELTIDSGVAVGSSIGHAIGGFFGGGSSAPAEPQQQDQSVAAQGQAQNNNNWGARSCEADAKQFTKCLDDNQGNMQICSWYLEQLVSHLVLFAVRSGMNVANHPVLLESLPICRKPVLARVKPHIWRCKIAFQVQHCIGTPKRQFMSSIKCMKHATL